MINKVVKNAEEAIHDIQDNAVLMLGGFGLCGIPENCIAAILNFGELGFNQGTVSLIGNDVYIIKGY